MNKVEPFELNGKIIKECFVERVKDFGLDFERLVIELDDGVRYFVEPIRLEDEITGNTFTDVSKIAIEK